MCFLPARGAGSSLTQGTGRENVYKRPRARQPAQRSRIRRRRERGTATKRIAPIRTSASNRRITRGGAGVREPIGPGPLRPDPVDRKSAAQGKGVAVRAEPGGGRAL